MGREHRVVRIGVRNGRPTRMQEVQKMQEQFSADATD